MSEIENYKLQLERFKINQEKNRKCMDIHVKILRNLVEMNEENRKTYVKYAKEYGLEEVFAMKSIDFSWWKYLFILF